MKNLEASGWQGQCIGKHSNLNQTSRMLQRLFNRQTRYVMSSIGSAVQSLIQDDRTGFFLASWFNWFIATDYHLGDVKQKASAAAPILASSSWLAGAARAPSVDPVCKASA